VLGGVAARSFAVIGPLGAATVSGRDSLGLAILRLLGQSKVLGTVQGGAGDSNHTGRIGFAQRSGCETSVKDAELRLR